MEEGLKIAVGASRVENLGEVEGGWINKAYSYQTDRGKFFIKVNGNEKVYYAFT